MRLISDRKATPKEKKQYSISDERLKELQNIRDSAIDTSDIRELDDRLWEQGKMLKPLNKKAISIRIDSEVLDWFKSQRKKYQSLFNKYGFAFIC
ncbi:BrnA antitoxin family protein [Planktothricoides raciborskii]|uniref:BrnA antitoxin family protein n=1 Tax=Planktothricoides raciborskii TaxID=132608 RepID=UPI00405584D6